MSASGPKRTSHVAPHMSAFGVDSQFSVMRPVCGGLLCAKVIPSTSLVGQTMTLSEAKSHTLIAMAILISAVMLGWSAEAKPKGGSKPLVTDAMRDIRWGIGTVDDFGSVACYAQNKNINMDICAVFEYYNSDWWFSSSSYPTRVQRRFTPREIRLVDFGAWAPRNQRLSLHCKLVSARYVQPSGKDLFTCPY